MEFAVRISHQALTHWSNNLRIKQLMLVKRAIIELPIELTMDIEWFETGIKCDECLSSEQKPKTTKTKKKAHNENVWRTVEEELVILDKCPLLPFSLGWPIERWLCSVRFQWSCNDVDLSLIYYDVIECDWFTIILELSSHPNQHVLSAFRKS